MTEDREPTAAEIEAWQREELFIPADETTVGTYPRISNMSAGFIYNGIIRPEQPETPEYVTIPMKSSSVELDVAVSRWNMLWESAQFRRRFFDSDELPGKLGELAELGDVNLLLVPRTATRYFEYAPLLHLLSRRTLEHFGLPLLRMGQWPFLIERANIDKYLPHDFERRLSRAWAWEVWPHLNSGSGLRAFSEDDPIRLLAHNLDFWVPPVTSIIQGILREFPEVDKGVLPGPVPLIDGGFLEGAVTGNPRMGGDIWCGEREAADVLKQTVNEGDSTGRLREILDAVRSNRLEDDFSDRWSYAREDFERKLYNKRAKVSVRFVELTDTIPVQGPESEVLGNMVTNDFLALLDEQQRQVVILLNSGWTKQKEIAERLGYANHSPISKRLTDIRKTAEKFFGE
ncbi:sigma-70 family RNA polymerase sigma factor [Rhodococcus sp. P-2]|uniref:sigma-70 family RNA polymerase sigma factor n=1 Tax=Rhodococcus sp. P-2 TaxID=2795031 RepID=UPI0019034534|nr:sigma-70 family RNA polymerase sigma factor [Rhodococcus sp. P-2]QQM22014.1 sigma-70 family RNA polymerase sigma factor [Rhodococcus sp. P-2]